MDTNNIVVTDIKMPFRSMVNFMVKWTLASIPAMLFLGIIGWLFFHTLVAVLTSGN